MRVRLLPLLIAGLLSVAMLVLHGGAWLSVKAERGPVLERARLIGTVAGVLALLLFAAGGLYVAYGGLGYRITGALDVNGFSNPLRTTVQAAPGAWLDNYGRYPWMVIAPALGFLGTAAALVGLVVAFLQAATQLQEQTFPYALKFLTIVIMLFVTGSLIGGIAQTQEMLDFCAEHGITADIEMIRADEIEAAYERMLAGDVKYRFVMDIASMAG